MANQGKLFGLTQRDRDSLEEARRRAQQRAQNTRREGSSPSDGEEFFSDSDGPAIHIARVPEDGIPGLDLRTTGTGSGADLDNVPGYADDCEIYRILLRGDLTGGGTGTGTGNDVPVLHLVDDLTKRVYNVSPCAIEADAEGTWVPIVRTFGTWIAVAPIDCTACPSPGWDSCHRMVHRVIVECVSDTGTSTGTGGSLQVTEDVTFWRLCGTKIYSITDIECPDTGTP